MHWRLILYRFVAARIESSAPVKRYMRAPSPTPHPGEGPTNKDPGTWESTETESEATEAQEPRGPGTARDGGGTAATNQKKLGNVVGHMRIVK